MSSSVIAGGVPHRSSAIIAQAVEGWHVLRIDGYSRTKGLGNGKSIDSATFDVGGHGWCIRYYPNGQTLGSADCISMFLVSKQAEVKATFGFSILDHVGDPVPSYTKVLSDLQNFHCKGIGWGFDRFITRKALEESAYLKDDCFRVRCDITVSKEICTEVIPQFVMVPPSDMHQHIGRLLSSGVEEDVTFQVGEEALSAHRLVLGARSSVFMAELLGPLKEKNRHIQVVDMEPRVFKAMLHFIYTDSLPEIEEGGDTVAMAQHLFVAADRYGLERLKLICEDKLCNCMNTSTVTTTLVLAEQHGCKGLKEACFKFLKSPSKLKTILDSDEFQHLTSSCPSILNELLANVAP